MKPSLDFDSSSWTRRKWKQASLCCTSQKQITGWIASLRKQTQPPHLLSFPGFQLCSFNKKYHPRSFLQCLCLMMLSTWPFLDFYASNVTVSYTQERNISHRRDVCLSRTVHAGCIILLICWSLFYLWSHYEVLYLSARTNNFSLRHVTSNTRLCSYWLYGKVTHRLKQEGWSQNVSFLSLNMDKKDLHSA